MENDEYILDDNIVLTEKEIENYFYQVNKLMEEKKFEEAKIMAEYLSRYLKKKNDKSIKL